MEDFQSENYLEKQIPTKKRNWFMVVSGAVLLLLVPISVVLVLFGAGMSSGGVPNLTLYYLLLFGFMISGPLLIIKGANIKIRTEQKIGEGRGSYVLRSFGYLFLAFLLANFSGPVSEWLANRFGFHGQRDFSLLDPLFLIVGFFAYYVLIKSQVSLKRKVFLSSVVFLIVYLLLPNI